MRHTPETLRQYALLVTVREARSLVPAATSGSSARPGGTTTRSSPASRRRGSYAVPLATALRVGRALRADSSSGGADG